MQPNGYYQPFASDPFFSDVNTQLRQMNQQFNHMVGGYSGFPAFYPALNSAARMEQEQQQQQHQQQQQQQQQQQHQQQQQYQQRQVEPYRGFPSGNNPNAVQPFGMLNNPFSMMDAMISNMHQSMAVMQSRFADTQRAGVAQGGQVFSSSSFYSYSADGSSGQPRVVEAHSAERRVPGGVRETRRAYRDSDSGVAKMAIGHHLDERAHIMERSENRRTGQREQRNEYRGFEETEAPRFNEEWQERTRGSFDQRDRFLNQSSSRSDANGHRAIEHR